MKTLYTNKFSYIFATIFLLCSTQSLANVFPADFAWGASTAAYQIEGAWNVSGKGPSWWDWWNAVGNLPLNETGKVADEFYYRFHEDVALMKKVGLKNFRMSISWPRVLPNGTVDSPNPDGIAFYNQVFQALLDAGIQPWVTLIHNDLPQALSFPNATGGFLNPEFPDIFNAYADFCFKTFGDKVKHWITFNEPAIVAWNGYGAAYQPPFRCSPWYSAQCATLGGGGNSSTEPYIVGHHVILAHSKAFRTYQANYKATQGGEIGMTLNTNDALPWNISDPNDITAVETYLQFTFGWYFGPLHNGDYPEIMREYITGGRLPNFTDSDSQLIKGAYDFIGINHYTTVYVHYNGSVGSDYSNDSRVVTNTSDIHGNPIGPVGESDWLFVYPPGMRGILNWISKNYDYPPIVILENGLDVKGESELPVIQALADYKRISYLDGYIDNLVTAVEMDGANVKGYFVWAWMDNFEWGSYIPRFGLVYVDYNNNLTRTPKASAYWYIQKTKQIREYALGQGDYPDHSLINYEEFGVDYTELLLNV